MYIYTLEIKRTCILDLKLTLVGTKVKLIYFLMKYFNTNSFDPISGISLLSQIAFLKKIIYDIRSD